MGEPQDTDQLRSSTYLGWHQEFGYGLASPLYDFFVTWATLPIGSERKLRQDVASWLGARTGDEVLSLCCGTGATNQALLELAPNARITGINLGRAQLWQARRKDATGHWSGYAQYRPRPFYRLRGLAATLRFMDSSLFHAKADMCAEPQVQLMNDGCQKNGCLKFSLLIYW